MSYNKVKTLFIFLILVFTAIQIGAEGESNNKGKALRKVNGEPLRTRLNVNNISTWIYNNGDSDIDPNGNSGLIFPKGSNKAAIFESGFVWGASVNNELRVGGSTYSQGLLPGKILPNGQRQVAQPGDDVRIFRVRPDWAAPNADFSSEIGDGEGTKEEIVAQYQKDWNSWPAQDGAPYEDVDGNGQFNADVDIPGFPGADQTIWYVANDLDSATCQSLYGSDPMGIEMQATFWAYKSSSALGNTFFRKYKIINKSADTFEDMYVSMWSDPDVGDAGDDFSGCDVDLSLMYTYNGDADDGVYGRTPPAAGFDFFQGPIIAGEASDQAIFNNKIRTGYKNLPMSVHYFFINSDPVYNDPDLGDYNTGTLQFHNLFRGLITTTGSPFTDPNTGEVTKFTLSGDPVTGQGWIDGQIHPPGDRRQGMVAGPFTMAAGDTQEVVVAELVAGAFGTVDRLGAVQLLKFYDQEAQSAYDNFFQIPKSPTAPSVVVSSLDEEIVLNWDSITKTEIESYNDLGYSFQGYVVYQYPSANAQFEDAKIVATFDLVDGIGKVIGPKFDVEGGVVLDKVVKFGNDGGIKRYIKLKSDLFKGGAPLNNGTPYYFAVTSYCVNKDLAVVPNVLESELIVNQVTPKSEDPGYVNATTGDLLMAAHTGPSDGFVNVVVVNADKLTGHDYEVTFSTVDSMVVWNNLTKANDTLFAQPVWNLRDVTANVVKLSNQINQNADETSPIVDGLQFKVSGAPKDFKSFEVVANGAGPLDPPEAGAFEFQGFPVPHAADGTALRPTQRQQVGTGLWGIHTGDPAANRGSYATFLSRSARNDDFDRLVPYDWEMRFTARGSWAVRWFEDGTALKVPFELWNIGVGTPNDPSDDYRLIPYFLSTVGGGGDLQTDTNGLTYQLDPVDHGGSGGANDPQTPWIYWIRPHLNDDNSAGTAGYDEYISQIDTTKIVAGEDATVNFGGGTEVLARTVLVSWNGDDVSDGSIAPDVQMVPEQGTVLRIITTKPNSSNDKFLVTAPAYSYDATKAAQDVKDINVFPNPYYGVNPNEINKYQRYVTFNHLPVKATIRLFNMGGQLVNTVIKDNTSQFARWNLQNENGLPVASGIYIAYIDMPELGKTKVLKVAIIQETQILDRF